MDSRANPTRPAEPLVLEREAKLASLLPASAGRRLEASGVLAGDGSFYVVFDNGPDIGRPPSPNAQTPRKADLTPHSSLATVSSGF